MNNVETFAAIPIILERGAQWWKDQGVNGGERAEVLLGLRATSSARRVLRARRARSIGRRDRARRRGARRRGAVGAVQPGGASTNFLGPDCVDLPLTFDAIAEAGSALGTGAMVVLAEGTDLLAAATNVLNFFRNESCGKCVPCRVGSHKAQKILVEVLERGGGAVRRGRARSTSSRRRCG